MTSGASASAAAAVTTAFLGNEVTCPAGFQCVSMVNDFGVGHDGAFGGYQQAGEVEDELFELGCPAVGSVTASGECLHSGDAAADSGLCWSMDRYDTQTCHGHCRCVRIGGQHRVTTTVQPKTSRVLMDGEFAVVPDDGCADCAAIGADGAKCDLCGCVPTTRIGADGLAHGACDRPAPDADGALASDRRLASAGGAAAHSDLEYLRGRRQDVEHLRVLAHFPLWDPQEGGGKVPTMPFERRRPPLSPAAWLAAYPSAASRVQWLMDDLVDRTKAWAREAAALDCVRDDVAAKLEQVLAVRRGCRKMQTIAQTLRAGEFSPTEGTDTLRCVKESVGAGPKEPCKTLNCYSIDEDFDEALKVLRQRVEECHAQLAEEARRRMGTQRAEEEAGREARHVAQSGAAAAPNAAPAASALGPHAPVAVALLEHAGRVERHRVVGLPRRSGRPALVPQHRQRRQREAFGAFLCAAAA